MFSAEILAALQDYVYGVWIGHYIDVRSREWVWADNSNPVFNNWYTGKPDGVS